MTNADATPTFTLDRSHPGRLRCETCGRVLELPDDSDRTDRAENLTARQACQVWPQAAEAIRRHEVLCFWLREPPG